MTDSKIIETVARAMTRYVEGSFNGSPDDRVIWQIHDSWDANKIVAVFYTTREARDDRLRELNARAAIAAHVAALETAGIAIAPMEPTKEMLIAARDWSISKHGRGVGDSDATGCWRAMIAARPDRH